MGSSKSKCKDVSSAKLINATYPSRSILFFYNQTNNSSKHALLGEEYKESLPNLNIIEAFIIQGSIPFFKKPHARFSHWALKIKV